MNNPHTSQRKRLFVQPAFQGKFIFWIIIVVLIASAVSALLLYFLLTTFFESKSQSAHIILSESWKHLGVAIIIGNLVALLIGSVIAAFIVLYRSHKIAGPLYRFCRTFEQIGEGRLDDLMQLRKHDELSEVAESIQQMIDKLKQRRQQDQKHIQTALDALKHLENKSSDDEIIKIRHMLEKLLVHHE